MLGYTYDWGNPVSDLGLSEFVTDTGATVGVGQIYRPMFIVVGPVEMGLDEIIGRDFGLRGGTSGRCHRASGEPP